MLARISSWVRALVQVMWQSIWGSAGKPAHTSVAKEKGAEQAEAKVVELQAKVDELEDRVNEETLRHNRHLLSALSQPAVNPK